MADIDVLVEEVENSPVGPEVGAFFDFDGTLIDGYSAVMYFRERLKNRDIGLTEILRTAVESVNVERRGHDVTELMNIGVGALAGRSVDEIEEFGDRLFRSRVAGMVYPEARVLLEAHRRRGHTVVLASSATSFQTRAAALDLGIDHVLCTEVHEEDGILTGAVAGPILWGENKADAVREFADVNGIDLDISYTYSNGGEDVPFLESSGNPRPLNPDSDLEATAAERDWPVAYLTHRHRHSPENLVRTVAAYSSMGAGVALGGVLGLLNRNRATGLEVAATVGSRLALTTAGVELEVQGEENLWAARPAVFVFNHQSQLDVVILAALLRRDFTAVAKKELSRDPFFAPMGWLADIAYVDRSNSVAAREALAPAVDALTSGQSLIIAPEGTRSSTPRLLPFKKGAFHLAMQAGVPMVPVVIRNAGEVLPSHSIFIAKGTVQVAVLPPVSTAKWKPATVDRHVESVRAMFVDTLADWPH